MGCETCAHSRYDCEEDLWTCRYGCDPWECDFYEEQDECEPDDWEDD